MTALYFVLFNSFIWVCLFRARILLGDGAFSVDHQQNAATMNRDMAGELK
jgi:hypothetical protein